MNELVWVPREAVQFDRGRDYLCVNKGRVLAMVAAERKRMSKAAKSSHVLLLPVLPHYPEIKPDQVPEVQPELALEFGGVDQAQLQAAIDKGVRAALQNLGIAA